MALGLLAMWPPDKKLKLGIDLSGGTILVYEVARENLPPSFNMDELISALKKRADPRRRQGNPDPQDRQQPHRDHPAAGQQRGGRGSQEDADGRRLARVPHPGQPQARCSGGDPARLGPAGLAKPPARYKWARLGEISTGTNPTFTSDTITDLQQNWKKDLYAGTDVILTGKDASRDRDRDREHPGQPKHGQHVDPGSAPWLEVDQLRTGSSTTPAASTAATPAIPGPTTRSSARKRSHRAGPRSISSATSIGPAGSDRQVPARGYATTSTSGFSRPSGFEFDRQGARRFGQLTREHLPEEGDAFKYQLAILLDNLVMSAPSINSEIRDSGIIEGGAAGVQAQGSRAPDQRAPGGQPAGEPEPDARSRKKRSARRWAKTRSPRACAPSGSRCWSCRSSWSSTTGSPASWRSSPWSST